MIFNFLCKSFSLFKPSPSIFPTNAPSFLRMFSRTQPLKGLEEFFEDGKAFPIYDQDKKVVFGRAWKASELRNKSFEELHKLWFVLLKERNLLATQEAESRRLGQMFFGKHRETKCKISMARIKSVLSERQALHKAVVNLVAQKENGAVTSESDLLLQANQQEIHGRAEIKRKVRKSLNYMKRRQPLFT